MLKLNTEYFIHFIMDQGDISINQYKVRVTEEKSNQTVQVTMAKLGSRLDRCWKISKYPPCKSYTMQKKTKRKQTTERRRALQAVYNAKQKQRTQAKERRALQVVYNAKQNKQRKQATERRRVLQVVYNAKQNKNKENKHTHTHTKKKERCTSS